MCIHVTGPFGPILDESAHVYMQPVLQSESAHVCVACAAVCQHIYIWPLHFCQLLACLKPPLTCKSFLLDDLPLTDIPSPLLASSSCYSSVCIGWSVCLGWSICLSICLFFPLFFYLFFYLFFCLFFCPFVSSSIC